MHGLLLAAGAGLRMGMPKAVVIGDSGEPWIARAVESLWNGGCDRVTVALGASADLARPLVPATAGIVIAHQWPTGMSSSLRAGLATVALTKTQSVMVHLVDLPDVSADVVRRVAMAGDHPHVLARSTYKGRPGHPVLLGRCHWDAVVDTAKGDAGARAYLASKRPTQVECGDIADGGDGDRRH